MPRRLLVDFWYCNPVGHAIEALRYFNDVPFHSVVPDPARSPAYSWGAPLPLLDGDEDGEGPRTPRMSRARVREDLPELLDAAGRLLRGEIDPAAALAAYVPRLVAAYGGDEARAFTFDGAGAPYLPSARA